MDFVQALSWAKGPGIAVIAGIIISFAIEYWPAFQTLQAKNRVLVYILLCLFVPILATAVGLAAGLGGAWNDIANVWWPPFAAGIFAASIGTLFHAYVPEPAAAKASNSW